MQSGVKADLAGRAREKSGSRSRAAFAIIGLLAIASVISGCAGRYGTAAGPFGRVVVVSRPAVDFHIVQLVDFRVAFSDNQREIPVTTSRLVALLQASQAGRTNQTAFPYRAGRYYLSFRCGNFQRFDLVEVAAGNKVQRFRIGCRS